MLIFPLHVRELAVSAKKRHLFIWYGKNNFTAVKLPVFIHIIIIYQKIENKEAMWLYAELFLGIWNVQKCQNVQILKLLGVLCRNK